MPTQIKEILASLSADLISVVARNLPESKELEGLTGNFYSKMEEKEPNNLAFDKEKQEELWNLSLKLTDLDENI